MSVHIEEDECIGCGTCEEICPEVFRFNTDTEGCGHLTKRGT